MKYALITGASAGIGAEIAKQLAARGYNIILTARRKDRLKEFCQELLTEFNVKVDYFAADLAEPDAPQALYDFCKSKNYDVEVLINNAGYGLPAPFHKTPMEQEEKFIRVLGISVIALTKLFIPDMLKAKNGYIMIVSSVASFAPPSTIQVLYGPIKTFMNRFSDAMNISYKYRGISSTSVCPGFVITEFHSASGTQKEMDKVPAFMKLDVESVAEEGLDAMFKRKRMSIPSKRYKIIVFLIKYAPKLVSLLSNRLTGGRYRKRKTSDEN